MNLTKPFIVASLLLISACTAQNQHPPKTLAPAKSTLSNSISIPLFTFKKSIKSADLLGKSNSWVIEKLGQPIFMRADSNANIWLYENKNCRLSLFLYAEADPALGLRILHFDARDHWGHSTDRDQCLATF